MVLRRWSHRKFGNTERQLKKKTKALEALQKNEGPGDIEAIKQLLREIEYILEQEDVRWNNWGKQNWYMNGDQNTPFFHAWATHRRKINHIKKIEDEEGREWGKPEEVRKAFIDFYQQLFTTEDVVRVD